MSASLSNPRPAHLEHAPCGELNENKLGSSFPTEKPQCGQA